MIPKLNNIPILGLGTWDLRGNQCVETVKLALELGYTHIDTAESYNNENEIGIGIKSFDRSKLFITSKVWPGNLKHDDVLKACDNSLNKLGTGYLDLYLIHWPSFKIPLEESLPAFNRLFDQGKIKAFGISNFTIPLVKESLEKAQLPIITNQVEFHPLLYQKELLDFCKSKNIVITAYCPVARGHVFNNKVLVDIGIKYNKTAAQISLKWLLQKGIIAIPKASSVEHLKENIDVFDFELSSDDIEKINNINEDKRLVPLGF